MKDKYLITIQKYQIRKLSQKVIMRIWLDQNGITVRLYTQSVSQNILSYEPLSLITTCNSNKNWSFLEEMFAAVNGARSNIINKKKHNIPSGQRQPILNLLSMIKLLQVDSGVSCYLMPSSYIELKDPGVFRFSHKSLDEKKSLLWKIVKASAEVLC